MVGSGDGGDRWLRMVVGTPANTLTFKSVGKWIMVIIFWVHDLIYRDSIKIGDVTTIILIQKIRCEIKLIDWWAITTLINSLWIRCFKRIQQFRASWVRPLLNWVEVQQLMWIMPISDLDHHGLVWPGSTHWSQCVKLLNFINYMFDIKRWKNGKR